MRPPGGRFLFVCVREVTGLRREAAYDLSQEVKGGLNDARLFHHCNRRHYGGGRTWRVLLASPASGADATSEISEYLNLSISHLPAPVAHPGLLLVLIRQEL